MLTLSFLEFKPNSRPTPMCLLKSDNFTAGSFDNGLPIRRLSVYKFNLYTHFCQDLFYFSLICAILYVMSMFREHWLGGLTAYTIFFIVSLIVTVSVSIGYESPLNWNPTITMDPLGILACFTIALLFGLFPDVDIKSKSQKIFYTLLFIFNLSLIIFFRRYLEAAILGLFAMLPILSKHRGWTHSRITMILLPGLFLVIPLYVEFSGYGVGWKKLPDVFDALVEHENLDETFWSGLAFYSAGLIGYASHLYLDGILFHSRKSKIRKTEVKR